MNRRVFIYINGINALPGDSDGWTDRAVTWTHIHRPDAVGEKYEYLSFTLTRRLKQNKRARGLAKMVSFYRDHPITLVGHSNGCDIILRVLELVGRRIERVVFIAPACESDFVSNNMNDRLRSDRVGQLGIMVGKRDWAMKLARFTQFLRPVGLGYGDLGRTGPRMLDPIVRDRVNVIEEPEFGHSTWFCKQNFDTTMRLVTHN